MGQHLHSKQRGSSTVSKGKKKKIDYTGEKILDHTSGSWSKPIGCTTAEGQSKQHNTHTLLWCGFEEELRRKFLIFFYK